MVDVEIVEEVMVDELILLPPVNVVLPPTTDKVLLFKARLPVPLTMVIPLTVVKVGVAETARVDVPLIWISEPAVSKEEISLNTGTDDEPEDRKT